MFKDLVTALCGRANAADKMARSKALVILDQQIRDAGASIWSTRPVLAIAIAEDRQEAQRTETLAGQIASLGDRARAALAGTREDLAVLAAGTIAEFEMDRDASTKATALFGAEIAQMRQTDGEAEWPFGELKRGRRLAQVGEAVSRSRHDGIIAGSALRNAEETLAGLRSCRLTLTAAEEALEELTSTRARIEDRLGQAGFAPATRPTATTVLARLRPLNITKY